jgi:peptide/nickel transport system ATP-binding protein
LRADWPLLAVDGVRKIFGGGVFGPPKVVALDDVSFEIAGDRPAIVTVAGESGCGKTTLARIVLGLLRPSEGAVRHRGAPISGLRGAPARAFRRDVQAVFQDPFAAFNPFYRVDHVFDVLVRGLALARDRREARALIGEALERVGLDAGDVLGRFPHELSGGQVQRVMVARAFLVRPQLIVADEPVSMVDASLRRTVLDSMRRLRDVFGVSFLYVTHDLSTAYEVSDEILILHGGRIVERGATRAVLDHPTHAYTRQLVSAVPIADPEAAWRRTRGGRQRDAIAAGAQP